MATCEAQGIFGKILVMPKTNESDSDPTFSGSSERYSFLYETMKTDRELHGTRSIYGTQSMYSTTLSLKPYTPNGMLGLQPGPLELDKWLPRILGATESSDVFAVAETLPIFDMLVYRDNGTFHYKNCRVNQAVFSGKSGPSEDESEIIQLGLHIIGMDEVTSTSWPGTIPSVPVASANAPYIFSQGVLNVSSDYPIDEFKLVINNNLQVRHRNSLKPSCVFSAGRTVRLEVGSPFSSNAWTLMDTLYTTGSSGTLTFTNGGLSTQFSFANLRGFRESPTVRGKGGIPLSLKLQAYRTSSTAEIVVTSDSVA